MTIEVFTALVCPIDECPSSVRAGGLCSKHYQRRRKYGNPETVYQGRPPRIGEDKRFDCKYIVDKSDCWLWQANIHANGYGKFKSDSGKTLLAHRFSYERAYGAISPDLQIDHLCRVRSCVNPSHLEQVTAKVNTYRGVSFSAVNAFKTHCVHGHSFDADNTRIYYFKDRPHRACRSCARARNLRTSI